MSIFRFEVKPSRSNALCFAATRSSIDFQLVYRKHLQSPWVVLLARPDSGKQLHFAEAMTTMRCNAMLRRIKKRFPEATWRDPDVADWVAEEIDAVGP